MKSDSFQHNIWIVWLLSTWNVKRDSSPHSSLRQIEKVNSLHVKCDEWLLCTGSGSSPHKMVYSPHQMWRVTPHDSSAYSMLSDSSVRQIWRVAPIHNKCEEWLLSTPKVKSDYSLWQIWRVILNKMSDYSPHQIWSDYSPHQIWRVTPLYVKFEEWRQMWRVTFSISNVKSYSCLRQTWKGTPLHL
jgi:hypothetical protein